jgi:hypothetical protein
MATKTRSSMAKEVKKRALMKDIDEREAEEAGNPTLRELLTPYRGVTAKSALRKAENANIDADPYGVSSNVKDSLAGRDRDLRSIEKYGDDAMRSKNFGSRETKKMNMGGMVNATVRPMGMMGGGNVGYTHGGKVDGCSSIQMSGRRPGKTY